MGRHGLDASRPAPDDRPPLQDRALSEDRAPPWRRPRAEDPGRSPIRRRSANREPAGIRGRPSGGPGPRHRAGLGAGRHRLRRVRRIVTVVLRLGGAPPPTVHRLADSARRPPRPVRLRTRRAAGRDHRRVGHREQRTGRLPPSPRAAVDPQRLRHPALLSCVEPDGGSCGGWTVAGAGNVDWEDIAAGPGPQPGEHYLYVGDIGDNTKSRDDVVVYRVVEPTVPIPSDPGADGVTAPATALRLRYDDGPHDAESLMVHPTTGDIYVITKSFGDTRVYKAPPGGRRADPGRQPRPGAVRPGHGGRHLPRRTAGGGVHAGRRLRADR